MIYSISCVKRGILEVKDGTGDTADHKRVHVVRGKVHPSKRDLHCHTLNPDLCYLAGGSFSPSHSYALGQEEEPESLGIETMNRASTFRRRFCQEMNRLQARRRTRDASTARHTYS